MRAHVDRYPQYVVFDKNEEIFLWKEYLYKLFKELDKDTQIDYLTRRMILKDSDLTSRGSSKDVFLYGNSVWLTKVGFFSYHIDKDSKILELDLLITSNINFQDYIFTDQDDKVFWLDKVNVPYLWHAIILYLINYAKKNDLTQVVFDMPDLDLAKNFFKTVVTYLSKKKLIKDINYKGTRRIISL